MSEKRERPEPWSEFQKGTSRMQRPLWFMEWCCEWMAYRLSRWAFLEVLECIGKFSLIFGLLVYIREIPERRKANHFQAWQVINSAQGRGGDGGRSLALRALADDHIPLNGVNLRDAVLKELQLTTNTQLRHANFSSSAIESAACESCDFRSATFQKASIYDSKFTNADFYHTDFSNSKWRQVNLAFARFDNADVSGAEFVNVNFAYAQFTNVDGWKEIKSFRGCNIYRISGPEEFVKWARAKGAVETNIADFTHWMNHVRRTGLNK